jgi:hypothetical protein
LCYCRKSEACDEGKKNRDSKYDLHERTPTVLE